MKSVLFCLLLLLLYWIIEYKFHQINLGRIKTRILVTGTRGKTSITRLIAAGLNAGAIKTLAKTTGSATQIVLPDNTVQNVNRIGNASILEQSRIVSRAVKLEAQALVIESMALRPHLQWVESFRIVKPNILIISNVGPDHLDITGRDRKEIAASFSNTIPPHGELFTCEKNFLSILEKQAQAEMCNIHELPEDDSIADFSYHELPYIEHPQNIKLALAVCEFLGVNRETAFMGMKKVNPDIGVLREIKTKINSYPVTFINAFAANDPDAIRKIYTHFKEKYYNKKFILIINLRNDRRHRTLQIAELLLKDIRADLYVFCGGDMKSVILGKIKTIVKKENIEEFNKSDMMMQYLEKNINTETVIMGIGNIAGAGIQMTNYFMEHEETGNEKFN